MPEILHVLPRAHAKIRHFCLLRYPHPRVRDNSHHTCPPRWKDIAPCIFGEKTAASRPTHDRISSDERIESHGRRSSILFMHNLDAHKMFDIWSALGCLLPEKALIKDAKTSNCPMGMNRICKVLVVYVRRVGSYHICHVSMAGYFILLHPKSMYT